MKKNRDEIFKYVNEDLQGHEGYIQPISQNIDEKYVFCGTDKAPILDKNDLIYEAHFFNASSKKSILIRQINDAWLVDETDLSGVSLDPKENPDVQEFYSKFDGIKIKMAQIWIEEKDEFCEKMPVLKFKKSAFAGFIRDKKDEK